MGRVRTYNAIAEKGLREFEGGEFESDSYQVGPDQENPDAIILRSYQLQASDIDSSVKAIGRAGAGVNNIPVAVCTERGIPVFNAPGANANAVKELVACAMLLCSRGIVEGIEYTKTLGDMTDSAAMHALLEKEKKQFRGNELMGKTLGVVGLGAIGSLVANLGLSLGMRVVGYDPAISVSAAWRLPSAVEQMDSLPTTLAKADFVSLHLPVLDSTRKMINQSLLSHAKPGACLLNFARGEIVDVDAVVEALDKGILRRYACDFPEPQLIARNDVILMPHIGASTDEAEENCAVMAAQQIIDFLEHGNITNSVNFPTAMLERNDGIRLTLANQNKPKVLSHVLDMLAAENLNVIDMLNKSRDEIAYNLIDLNQRPSDAVIAAVAELDGVINVRVL